MVLAGALTLGAMAYGQTPTITAVLDSATNTPDIAQGGIFIVKGTNLSGPGYTPAGAPPLLATIPGTNVKITFTPAAGGTSKDALMFYVYNQGGVNQLAALAPSSLAPGSYKVTVTYNGATSAPATTNVVQRKFGLLASDGTGTGLAVMQNYISQTQLDVNRFTTFSTSGITFSPAKPGQTLIAWGTGLGPITGDDSQAPGAVDFRSQVDIKVIVGGTTINPDYAGRSPYLPGADQINFTLPSNIPTGCVTTFQVSVGGRLSNQTFIAITPDGSASACVLPGFTTDQLTKLDQGGSYVLGNFNLTQFSTTMPNPMDPTAGPITAKIEAASGAFTGYKGTQLSSVSALTASSGACYVFRRTGRLNDLIYGPTSNDLDAGAVTLNGPNVTNQAFTKGSDNSYSLSLGTALVGITLPFPVPGFNTSPKITQGTYTVSGAGGADVGKFNGSVTVGPPLTLNAALPTSVDRSQSLSIGWTGGNASDTVALFGMSGSQVGGTTSDPIYDSGVFICTTTADKKGLTVPASILGQLPATPAANGSGILMVQSATQVTPTNGSFTAPLVKGGNIDAGTFQASTGSMQQTTYK
jgi:uncharacterized protein (TIGR03437 family)